MLFKRRIGTKTPHFKLFREAITMRNRLAHFEHSQHGAAIYSGHMSCAAVRGYLDAITQVVRDVYGLEGKGAPGWLEQEKSRDIRYRPGALAPVQADLTSAVVPGSWVRHT